MTEDPWELTELTSVNLEFYNFVQLDSVQYPESHLKAIAMRDANERDACIVIHCFYTRNYLVEPFCPFNIRKEYL